MSAAAAAGRPSRNDVTPGRDRAPGRGSSDSPGPGADGGNVVGAAQLLGISRGAMRYRMRQYGIERPCFPVSTPLRGRAPEWRRPRNFPLTPPSSTRRERVEKGSTRARAEQLRLGSRSRWRCWRLMWPGRRPWSCPPCLRNRGRGPGADADYCSESPRTQWPPPPARALAAYRGLWLATDPGAAAPARGAGGPGHPIPAGSRKAAGQ